jgi:hypothetical protein
MTWRTAAGLSVALIVWAGPARGGPASEEFQSSPANAVSALELVCAGAPEVVCGEDLEDYFLGEGHPAIYTGCPADFGDGCVQEVDVGDTAIVARGPAPVAAAPGRRG